MNHQKVIDLIEELFETDLDFLDQQEVEELEERVEQAKEYIRKLAGVRTS